MHEHISTESELPTSATTTSATRTTGRVRRISTKDGEIDPSAEVTGRDASAVPITPDISMVAKPINSEMRAP